MATAIIDGHDRVAERVYLQHNMYYISQRYVIFSHKVQGHRDKSHYIGPLYRASKVKYKATSRHIAVAATYDADGYRRHK